MKNLIQTKFINADGSAEETPETVYETFSFMKPKDIFVQIMLSTVFFQRYPTDHLKFQVTAQIDSYEYLENGFTKTKTLGPYDNWNNMTINDCNWVKVRLVYQNGFGSAIINIFEETRVRPKIKIP